MVAEGSNNVANVKIENANASSAGQYICYGFTEDRINYNITTVEVEIG